MSPARANFWPAAFAPGSIKQPRGTFQSPLLPIAWATDRELAQMPHYRKAESRVLRGKLPKRVESSGKALLTSSSRLSWGALRGPNGSANDDWPCSNEGGGGKIKFGIRGHSLLASHLSD